MMEEDEDEEKTIMKPVAIKKLEDKSTKIIENIIETYSDYDKRMEELRKLTQVLNLRVSVEQTFGDNISHIEKHGRINDFLKERAENAIKQALVESGFTVTSYKDKKYESFHIKISYGLACAMDVEKNGK